MPTSLNFLKKLKKLFIWLPFWYCLIFSTPIFAQELIEHSKFIVQQTELLKNRLKQAEGQLVNLKLESENQFLNDNSTLTNKQIRTQGALDIAVAKSNLDSIDIELSESQQSVSRLEKDIQEIENQLNVFNIFGLKIARKEVLNVNNLHSELSYQKKLLDLEKTRAVYLLQLQRIALTTLQLQKNKFAHLTQLLKTRTIMQLKEQEAVSEAIFQKQQSYWLQQLNTLYGQLNEPATYHTTHENLQREIFYANENLNLTYLQMLLVRYQEKLRQLKIAISHTTSITVLNKASEQTQLLTKQLVRVSDLQKSRLDILKRRKEYLSLETGTQNPEFARLNEMEVKYNKIGNTLGSVGQAILAFRGSLDKALQTELASRQGLPGFEAKAWFDLGAQLWLVPTLAFQVAKSMFSTIVASFKSISFVLLSVMALLEVCLVLFFVSMNKTFRKLVAGMAQQELGHINIKRLTVEVLRRNLGAILFIINAYLLFAICGVPPQSSGLLLNLMLVWLFFKAIINIGRICLVESAHDGAGHDVRLYHRLKWSFLVGGIITALTVFMHHLPVMYEIKDLFDRLFLLFLLVVSTFLLRSWDVFPSLILAHIDDHRLYLRKVVRLLGLLIPLILFVNSAIGLFGYVNLVLTVSWYESIFVMVLVGYLVVRGLLVDVMEFSSTLMIRHVTNGWLWTEAFLKPIDRVMRVVLFVAAWMVLFILYGWNQQSPVVERLNALLHYQLVEMLNTSISLINIMELAAVVAFLFWAARWSREFSFRFLTSRTQDVGLRNSLAIFTQYTTVVIGIFICLRVLGIDFKALTVVAGALAFGVGLGLRDLVNNFASGFLLLIERPIRVGDIVSVGEHEGEVTHIGGRAVTLRTWDHMEVLVPNTEIFSKAFVNWTGKDHIVRTVAMIKIHRHDSPHVVQSIIHQALAQNKDVLSEPQPEVFLKELSDSLIEFEVRYFVNLRQIKSRLGLRSDVLMAIWEAFENHDIHPPYPMHEVHVKSGVIPGYEKLLGRISLNEN